MNNNPRRANKTSIGFLRAVGRYYKDPSASILGKLFAIAAIVYVICPIDLIPDVPIVGWLDDIGVMGLATTWLMRRVSMYRKTAELPEGGGSARRLPFSVSP